MTLTQDGERFTLEMETGDFAQLLMLIGYASGCAHKEGHLQLFYKWLQFANDLNATNPRWRGYEIPPEYQNKPS